MGERRTWITAAGLIAVGVALFGAGAVLAGRPTDDPGASPGVLVLGGLALVTAGVFALLRAFSGDQ